MKTLADIKAHPLAPLFKARYDNNDVAFALDLPTFPEWRKNWERGQNFYLPRNDNNPARPRFRYAHVVEYALSLAFSKLTTKSAASFMVYHILRDHKDTAEERFNPLDDSTKTVIVNGNTFSYLKESDDPVKIDQADFWPLVEFPAIGFASDFLDRSAERVRNPIQWVMAPDIGDVGTRQLPGHFIRLGNNPSLYDALRMLSNRRWRGSVDNDGPGPRYRSASFLNLTGLLGDIEARLRVRVEAKEISGEDD